MEDFIEKIKMSLFSLGVDFESMRKNKFSMGLGISGGADSVSLFLALCEILKTEKIPLCCVTVNHHIRPDRETDEDMHFVERLCNEACNIGFDVFLDVYDLKNKEVFNTAEERKCGIEDAARSVRYECFEKSINKNNIGYFCLAHNADDNLENILMRFLNGSMAGGIESTRGKYIRPLLKTARMEIENFLNAQGQNFCTDLTNLSDDYFRNRVRHHMVPFLNENFPDWKNSVFSGDEKRREDNICLDKIAADKEFSLDLCEPGMEAIWSRVLIRELNKAGVQERIPKPFIKEVLMETRKSLISGKGFEMRFSNAVVVLDLKEKNGKNLFVKIYEKKETDFNFFDIIEKIGDYCFPFGKVTVSKCHLEVENKDCIQLDVYTENGNPQKVTLETDFPFIIRSSQLGEKKQLFVLDY